MSYDGDDEEEWGQFIIIDKIDEIASHHYGLPEEEQDFIINYEIKYRLGKSLSSRVQRKS